MVETEKAVKLKGSQKKDNFHTRNKWLCWYCGRRIVKKAGNGFSKKRVATIDHQQPKCKGGKGGKNRVSCCQNCNSLKGHLNLEEFREALETRFPYPVVFFGEFPKDRKEVWEKYRPRLHDLLN